MMDRTALTRRTTVLVAALTLVLSACAPTTTQGPGGSAALTPAGTRTLVIDLPGDAATLDPGLQYDTNSYPVYRNIFDQLLGRDAKSGKIEARIATSWKAVSPTEWDFVLRKDVKFHNGDPLTADDVKFSIDRILDIDFKSPQYQNLSPIAEVRVVDPATVRVVTKSPYPVLVAQLVNLSIAPAKYTREKGAAALNTAPVGSGPYRFVEWKKGESVTLAAAGSYWRGKPYFDTVTFRAVPERATRVADLQSGTADLAAGLITDDVKRLSSDAKLRVITGNTERVAYVAFNVLGKGPTAKREVREAIAAAIDPKKIIDTLLGGQAEPVRTLLTPLHFGYDASLPAFAYDPQKAKEALARAGLGSGVTVTFLTSPVYDQGIVQAIQGQLEAVGITVKIQSTDFPTYLKKIQGPEHDWGDIRFGQWSCACLDADGVIYPLFRTGSIWSSYSNPAYDVAVDGARNTLDEGKRAALYSTALRLLHSDVAAYGTWQVRSISGARATLDWQPTVDEQFFVFDMKNK